MPYEKDFGRDSFYAFVVKSNALLHKQAVSRGIEIIEELKATKRPLAVLDLACGSLPVSIAAMLEQCGPQKFEYTGVDLNCDQVEIARSQFTFSDNVTSARFIQGDAWNLDYLSGNQQFDIIFAGLHLHHGSPEECLHFFKQIRPLLSKDGVFINHDSYRPEGEPYTPKPAENPGNPGELLALAGAEVIKENSAARKFVGGTAGGEDQDWRRPFIDKLGAVLSARGAEESAVLAVRKHMFEHDYSLTGNEMKAIAESAGLCGEVIDYFDTSEPMKHYYKMLVCRKAAAN